jgi:hypothetical protein
MPDETRDDDEASKGNGGGADARPPEEQQPEEDEEKLPPITLDRYLSRRRGRSAVSWPHVGALIVMLAILVALVMYKDSCGKAVSSMIFMLSPDAGPQAPKARIELERPPSKPKRIESGGGAASTPPGK